MDEEFVSLQELAEEAGWTTGEFYSEIISIFAEMNEKILLSDPKMKFVEHNFHLGNQILSTKATLETLQ